MLKKNRKFLVNSYTAFYFALGIFYLHSIIGQTTITYKSWYPMSGRIVNIIVFLLLLYKILHQKYSIRMMAIILTTGLVTLLSYFLCDYQNLLWLFLFVVSSKNVNLRKVAKQTMWITIVAIIVVMALAQVGLIESVTQTVSSTRAYFWVGGNTIQLWGFIHHNYIGCRLLIIYMCYVFLKYDTYNAKDLIPFAIIFYACYYLFKSRTPAFIIVIVTLLVLAFKVLRFLNDKHERIVAKFILYGIMAFSLIFSVYASLNYNSGSPVYVLLDSLLTTRISSAHRIYSQYGFSVFGQYVELISSVTAAETGVKSIILDNAYMHMFIRFGVVVAVLILLGYVIAARQALSQKNYCVAIIIATYFICGISEGWLFNITLNPFLVLLSVGIYGSGIEEIDTYILRPRKFKIFFGNSEVGKTADSTKVKKKARL